MTIKTEEEETKLHVAVRMNDVALLRQSLTGGLDVNASGVYGWTALHEAASCGNLKIITILLKNGADPNIQDTLRKSTPVHLAAINGHLNAVKHLVRNGARLDLRDREGKIPQDCADDDCREFLQRYRAEGMIRLLPSPVESEQSLQKLYGRKSNGSPVYKKVRQSSPLLEETYQGSSESMSSSGSDSGESLTGLIDAPGQPGPGEINVSFEFNKRFPSLKIIIWELRDLKLPVDHNITHLYVKAYLLPDKHKVTKRKTSLLKIDSLRQGAVRWSSESVETNCESEQSESGDRTEKQMTHKVASAIKKTARLPSKKRERDQVKCMMQLDALESFCRVSACFEEVISYDTLSLSKVNLKNCEVLLTLCGRNRVMLGAQPLACISVPLAGAIKTVTPQWYPLLYKIDVSKAHSVNEHAPLKKTVSWELKDGGEFTGRSLAWNAAAMSMSMPNIEYSTSSSTSQMTTKSEQDTSLPEGQKKYRKHSGAVKLLRREFKILRGKTNNRYGKSIITRNAKGGVERDENAVESSCSLEEASSCNSPMKRAGSDFSVLNPARIGLSKAFTDKTRAGGLPREELDSRGRATEENNVCSETSLVSVECHSALDEDDHRPSFCRSLKYSRAFQPKLSEEQRKNVVLNDLVIDDEEEIAETPFAVNDVYTRGRRSLACQ